VILCGFGRCSCVTIAAGLIDGRGDGGLPFGYTAVQLAFRARAALRRTFISERVLDAGEPRPACRTARANLGAYVRVALSSRDTTRVSAHLECCPRCTATYLELVDVVSRPRSPGSRSPQRRARDWSTRPLAARTAHTILG
jgi:hypothetical protein